MLGNQMLYCKGMDVSDSDGYLSGDDKWDDSQLTAAYDKAVEMANIDVAKRISMATNGLQERKEPAQSQQKSKKSSKKKQWEAGMPCRAVYEADGLEYEAFVLRVVNKNECIVRFLGYDNSELVTTDSMKPSLGKEAQQIQIEQAALEKGEESDASIPLGDIQDETMSPRPTERSSNKRAKENKKAKEALRVNGFQLPEVPIPDLNKLRQLHSIQMPIAPPPISISASINSEDQAVSNMLLSWYMSGYYTGLYQGMRLPSNQSQSKPKE